MDKLDAAQRALAAACEKRDAAYDALMAADESELDAEALAALTDAVDSAQSEVDERKATADRIEAIMEARNATPAPVLPEPEKRHAQPKGTSKPENVYRPDNGTSFVHDVFRSFRGDQEARSRIFESNKIELETRDVANADPGAGAVVPTMYRGDLWEAKRRARRVTVNLLPTFDIGSFGDVFTIPIMNTGLTVAKQAGDNQNFSETDLDTNELTAYVETIGGLQDVSLQSLERSNPALSAIVVDDLQRAYDEEVERQVLHGAGHASNELPGLLGVTGNIDVTWTETTPAGTTGLKKVYDCISQQGTAFLTSRVIVMHSRRAAWFASQTTTAAPIFSQGGMTYAVGSQDAGYAGTLAGLPVYQSNAISVLRGAGTNQDVIFVLDTEPIRFGEDGAPRLEVFREPLSQTGGVRFRLYNYAALVADRQPKAIANIEGTGLVTPSFS